MSQVRAELAAIVPEVKDIPILAADPSDEKALDEVIGKVGHSARSSAPSNDEMRRGAP